ncbi:MAG TPA: RES family NAD+ phosphorylase [Patescibacteria group bacterium]|nr:RES family NAD+ phosphorylase [Patescibacteria group bacterium]
MPGSVWHHIFLDVHPDPLGFGYTPSRFSDPRKSPKTRFGVYYAGGTFEAAFLETLVRDTKNLNPGLLLLSATDLDVYVHVTITVQTLLDLADLRAGNPVVMGIPTDAVRAQSHRFGQRISRALHDHPVRPDGLCYPSRLNGDDNFAVYDRAVPKLSAGPRRKLSACPELAPILNRYRIAIV